MGELKKDRYIPVFFPDGSKIMAELAMTEEERQRGLMFREDLGENQGMLFLFSEEGIYPFWMKNMKFSIDILWLDKEKRVVHIEAEVPPCPRDPCPSYAPAQEALYVLELKTGWTKRHGLKLFDKIEFILPSPVR